MQRLTTEPTPTSPELLGFSGPEAETGFRAVRYHLEDGIQFTEAAYPERGLQALAGRLDQIGGYVDRTVEFVTACGDLAGKFNSSIERPDDPLELSVDEVFLFGSALRTLGVFGLLNAREAMLGTVPVGIGEGESRLRAAAKVEQTAAAALHLFTQLTPIGESKDAYRKQGWPIWHGPLPTPLSGLEPRD